MAQVDSVGMIFTHMAQSCKPSWFGKGRGSIRHKGSIRQMSHRRVYEYSQPLLESLSTMSVLGSTRELKCFASIMSFHATRHEAQCAQIEDPDSPP